MRPDTESCPGAFVIGGAILTLVKVRCNPLQGYIDVQIMFRDRSDDFSRRCERKRLKPLLPSPSVFLNIYSSVKPVGVDRNSKAAIISREGDMANWTVEKYKGAKQSQRWSCFGRFASSQ